MNAVMAVEWPITFEFSEDSKYNTLLQISVGQEEVDEVIGRDINRTFPEHPQFGFEQGQQALYRVLKAYSLHDLEVGYCQVGTPPPPTPPSLASCTCRAICKQNHFKHRTQPAAGQVQCASSYIFTKTDHADLLGLQTALGS